MIGVPKNVGRLDADERLAAKVQRLIERKRQRKPLKAKSWMKRGTKPLPARNAKKAAKKQASYRKVLASPFHKQLRYRAFERSQNLCECEDCVLIRGNKGDRLYGEVITADRRRRAFTEIPVWFTKGSGEPWRRFRSDDGELHHVSYQMFGDENPDELRLVRWVWLACHHRIEAEQGTRRRFLKGGKDAR